MPTTEKSSVRFITITLGIIGFLAIILLVIAGRGSMRELSLFIALSLASFIAGCLVGFLISSYGEETATIGKVRDWLVGGTSALTLANIGPIKAFLLSVGKAGGDNPTDIAITLSVVLLNLGIGFFFMYFGRELILNVLLARSRAEREKLEGSQHAGQVVRQFLLRLPASMLTGVQFSGEIDSLDKAEGERLKGALYSDEVDQFLEQAENAAQSASLDWETISKAAYIYYYRTYFDKEHSERAVDKALEWLVRAVTMNPNHVELTMKYAEMLYTRNEKDAAISILERLARRPEAPMLVLEWLGYYLRYIHDRLDDSIDYSKRYLANNPNDTDPLFNLAYAYGRKYCDELQGNGSSGIHESVNRTAFIANLKKALPDQPKMKTIVKDTWFKSGTGLECLKEDKDLADLLTSIPDIEPATSRA